MHDLSPLGKASAGASVAAGRQAAAGVQAPNVHVLGGMLSVAVAVEWCAPGPHLPQNSAELDDY